MHYLEKNMVKISPDCIVKTPFMAEVKFGYQPERIKSKNLRNKEVDGFGIVDHLKLLVFF